MTTRSRPRREVVRLAPRMLTAALAVLVLAGAGHARAVERGPYAMQVLVDGVPLAEHAARGKRYVEAREGREYAIRLNNRTSRRVAVALSVDGLNTIDARTTSAGRAAKWILGPYETITLTGWQTGSSTARRFYFTTEDASYGAWLGKTDDLGVISAAFFREVRPVRTAPITRPADKDAGRQSPRRMRESGGEGDRAAPAPAEKSQRLGADAREPELSDDLAATGIGREVEHRVRRVPFEAESSPAAVVELRYEYRDALVRLGVLSPWRPWHEDPLDRRERAHGFEDFDFAPDPYRD